MPGKQTLPARPRTGGEILADQLILHGADTVFAVPGESYLAALDAFHDRTDSIRLVICRHEAGAANMAEAYGKLTRKPGVCFVTRGPGACHASVGVHTARQDSSPMVLLVGQIARETRGREAFQEIDVRDTFQPPFSKWAVEVESASRLPEILHTAFRTAATGRPGPVVVGLPEDMLKESVVAADSLPWHPTPMHPPPDSVIRVRELLEDAEQPLIIAGGGAWTNEGLEDLTTFARESSIPIVVSFRRQDLINNNDSAYAGDLSSSVDPLLVRRVRKASHLLVVGARLGEMTTGGYTSPSPSQKKATLIHVYPDSSELGRVYPPDLAITADASTFSSALHAGGPLAGLAREEWFQSARRDYEQSSEPSAYEHDLDMGAVMRHLGETMPDDTVITIDAGNFSGWPQRFWRFRRTHTQLGPTSGAMGYSIPAGVAAAIIRPESPVLSFVGDGGFLMASQELATAIQYGATPIVLLINNAMFGTIRMHQEQAHPGRAIGTDLHNPNFPALARAYGAHGERVSKTSEFAPAFERARASGSAAVIELVVNPEQITTRTTISKLRDAASTPALKESTHA